MRLPTARLRAPRTPPSNSWFRFSFITIFPNLVSDGYAAVVGGGGFVICADYEKRAVVVRGRRAAEFIGGEKNRAGDVFDGIVRRNISEDGVEALGTKFFVLEIFRFHDTVRCEDHKIAWL